MSAVAEALVARAHEVKVCIVSSCGGHLTEVRMLRSAYEDFPHFYVINDHVEELPEDMRGRTYVIRHAERDWRVLVNVYEAWHILRRERPAIMLSTGAGPAVPFALIARLLGIRVLFVETLTAVVRPSLTGRLVYPLAHRFFYQWPALRRWFPRARCVGTVI